MNIKPLIEELFSVIIAGVDGQGNALMAFLIGRALANKGYFTGVCDT